MNSREFEEFIEKHPDEVRRLIFKVFKPKELLKVGNRSYIDAYRFPSSRFDLGDLSKCTDGHNCPPDPDMLQPLSDPGKLFTDKYAIPPSSLLFLWGNKIYAKRWWGQVSGGLTELSAVMQPEIAALATDSGEKFVSLKGGTYLATGTVIANKSNMTLEGEGASTVWQDNSPAGIDLIELEIPAGKVEHTGLAVQYMTLRGRDSDKSGHLINGLNIPTTSRIDFASFKRLNMQYIKAGKYAIALLNPFNVFVEECYFNVFHGGILFQCNGRWVGTLTLIHDTFDFDFDNIVGLHFQRIAHGLRRVTSIRLHMTGVSAGSTAIRLEGDQLCAFDFQNVNVEEVERGIEILGADTDIDIEDSYFYYRQDPVPANQRLIFLGPSTRNVQVEKSYFETTFGVPGATAIEDQNASEPANTIMFNNFRNFTTPIIKSVTTRFGRFGNIGHLGIIDGITGTFDVFDTDPTNPANMNDGDFTTETGEGIRNLGAPGDVGRIYFDLGASYPVTVNAHMNIHRVSGDGTLSVVVESSPDGITYYPNGVSSISGRTVDVYYPFTPAFLYGRYLRLRVFASATSVASVYHVKIAEVEVMDERYP